MRTTQRRGGAWTGLALAMLAVAAAAAPASAGLERVVSIEGITEYRLDNGLRVLLFPDDSRPTVTVNITIFVGSRHEGYGEAGMAHLLEHLLFKGTPTHPDIDKLLTERGARANGTTWVDRTNYFETLPASDENLEFAIRLEADRMVNSFIRREDLDSEMTVVRNEFERGENSPFMALYQRMLGAAFEWHNYGRSTIGNRSDIERVPIDRLRAFYEKHYRPDNAMLVVAGRFDTQKALGHIETYFGAIERPAQPIDRTYTIEPPQDGERRVTVRRVGDVGSVGVVYHAPAGPHHDHAAIAVLEDILTARPSGLLYEALIDSGKAASVFGMARGWHDPGVLMLMAQVRPDGSLDDVRDTMLAVIDRVVEEGVTEEQVRRSIQRFRRQRELALADTARIAIELSEWAAQGDWRLFSLHRDRVEGVTADQVHEVARRYLHRNNRTVGMFIPTQEPQRVAIPAAPDVETLVEGYRGREEVAEGEAFDPSPQNIDGRTQTVTLAGGVRAALLPKKTRGQSVHLRLTLRYGDERNLKPVREAAMLLPALMTRATKQLSRQQLQDALDENQATLGGYGGPGEMTFSVQTKRQFLPEVLELLRQVLREPALPREEFDNIKRQRLADLEESRSQPQALAMTRLGRSLSPYPKGDVRYEPTIDEQIEMLGAVTLEQVRSAYERYAGAGVGELAIVGDFDPEPTLRAVERALSGWESAVAYERLKLEAPEGLSGARESIETPDKANAVYIAGTVIPLSDEHEDYPALLMAGQVLGGSFPSRLVERIRQREGLSYSVGSQLNAKSLDRRAVLSIYAIANPANVPKVARAVDEELRKMLEEGPTEAELSRERENLLQRWMLTRSQDGSLAAILAHNLHTGRTMAWHADLESRIRSLTPQRVVEALRRHIDPDRFVIVTAGDFASVADEAAAGGQ